MKKSLGLLCVMSLGVLFPQAQVAAPVIPYFLMFILFFSFLEEKVEKKMFYEKRVFFIL